MLDHTERPKAVPQAVFPPAMLVTWKSTREVADESTWAAVTATGLVVPRVNDEIFTLALIDWISRIWANPTFASCMVKVTLVPDVPLDIWQEGGGGGPSEPIRFKVVVCELWLTLAVIDAGWVYGIAPAAAVNVAKVDPAATVTDVGTRSREFVLERLTTTPPEGAETLSPTVQLVVAADEISDGLHASPDTAAGARSIAP